MSWTVKWSEVALSCLTLCKPVDCSLPGSSVHGILQARILEWVAISFSRGSSQPRDWTQVSCIVGRWFILWATREVLKWLGNYSIVQFSSVQLLSRVWLFVTPCTVAYQDPPSMGFSRQEYWSGLPKGMVKNSNNHFAEFRSNYFKKLSVALVDSKLKNFFLRLNFKWYVGTNFAYQIYYFSMRRKCLQVTIKITFFYTYNEC